MTTINMHMKFEIEILDLCSGNHVVYRQLDGLTDGQGETSIPPSNFVGRGYNETVECISDTVQHYCKIVNYLENTE